MSTQVPAVLTGSDEFLTPDQAAVILNRTVRTIYNYIKKGYLTRKHHAGKVVLLRSEVVDFNKFGAELGNTNFLTPQVVAGLLLRVNRLEAQVTLVNRVLELQRDPLRISDHEAKLFYDGVIGQLTGPVTLQTIEAWSDQLLRVDFQFLAQISRVTGDEVPSLKCYRLSVRLIDCLQNAPGYETNLTLQVHFGSLDRARKNMLALAGEQIERGRITGKSHARIMELVGSREEELEKLAKMVG